MAREMTLARSRNFRKGHFPSHLSSPTPQLVGGTKGSFSGPQEFRATLRESDCVGSNGSGSLCSLLWRLLCWCHPRGIVLRAQHIPGCLNVIADKLSRHNQVIQTEWSLSQQVFNLLCSRWARPQLDLFATRFNHKLPSFVSPVPDQKAWAICCSEPPMDGSGYQSHCSSRWSPK